MSPKIKKLPLRKKKILFLAPHLDNTATCVDVEAVASRLPRFVRFGWLT